MSLDIDSIALAHSTIISRALRTARYFEMVATLAEMGDERMARLTYDAGFQEAIEVSVAFGDLSLFKKVHELDPGRKREAA